MATVASIVFSSTSYMVKRIIIYYNNEILDLIIIPSSHIHIKPRENVKVDQPYLSGKVACMQLIRYQLDTYAT